MLHTQARQRRWIFALLALGLALHAYSQWQKDSMRIDLQQALVLSGPSSHMFQAILAGPCLGLGADANLLSIFDTYHSLTKKSLQQKDKNYAWEYLYQYLRRAQDFDPWFWDIYRLTLGILAYNPDYTRKAIDMARRGGEMRTWDWEQLFIAGFLAHELLNDKTWAVELLRESATRPKAPPLIVGVTANILADTHSTEDSLRFLRMMKNLLPAYNHYIDERIQRLERRQSSSQQ